MILLRGRRIPGSKPDSTEDPPCICTCCMPNHTWGPNYLLLVDLERWCQLRKTFRHPNAIQNYE
ncbi:hypothetical protein AVEN_16057-1, partial [Araneus ventricosus]